MQFLGPAKRFLNGQFKRCGHTIAYEPSVPSFDRLVSLVDRAALTPRTVFDIGVAYGTPWLYWGFPQAKYYLVDPTRESLPYMEQWKARLDAEVINIGLGEQESELEIAVREDIGASSLYTDVGSCTLTAHYKVPVRRFDVTFGEFDRPALAKLDVQGAELMVLHGMGDRIHDLDMVIVETSLIATIHDGPEFGEIADYMRESQFALYDVVGMHRRPLDSALAQVDAVFVPASSALRRDRRWVA